METIKRGLTGIVCAGLIASATSAGALSINDAGVVGTVRSGEPASIADEVGYVNNLLGLGANVVNQVIAGHTYSTSSTDYSGTVSSAGAFQTVGTSVPAGYQYVLAKYDGPQGGDVLWYLNGASIVLPSTSAGLWANPGGNGYGISHFTVFNRTTSEVPPVPDGGTTTMLLGMALSGLALLRRIIS